MEKVYDNGEKIIGNVDKVKDYVRNNCESIDEVSDLLQDLEDFSKYNKNCIVMVNYDFPMNYSIDIWEKNDIVEDNKRGN